jgi:hypothetical protein
VCSRRIRFQEDFHLALKACLSIPPEFLFPSPDVRRPDGRRASASATVDSSHVRNPFTDPTFTAEALLIDTPRASRDQEGTAKPGGESERLRLLGRTDRSRRAVPRGLLRSKPFIDP